MLKVFLAEDEFVVREGIKTNIDWQGEGFVFCGEAADGELAFPMIQSEKPDIIITDIKMPFMDGLELSRLVKKELPQSKIIILSGHEEFSFAQEAIKIGVTEYLLKPINSTELIGVVKRVGDRIMAEREEMKNLERYKREMEENEIDNKRKLFNEMIQGTLSLSQILEKGEKLGIELSAQQYQIVLLKYNLSNEEDNDEELCNIQKDIYKLNTRFENVIQFDRAIEGLAYLIKGESREQLETVCMEFVNSVKAMLSRYPDVKYFGGIGTPVERLTRLSESFESAAHGFSLRFILDKNEILHYNDISKQWVSEETGAPLGALELGSVDLKKVEVFLKNGEAEEIPFFVEEFLNSIGSASEKSFLFRQYVLMDIYFTALVFLKEIGESGGLEAEPFVGPDQVSEVLNDTAKARDYIVHIFTVAIKRRDELSTKRYRRMIDNAKEYINEHYADEDISLNDTAAYVNISPSHFSAVFSRETGHSFIKYLTDLRMSKAKELLKCTDMRCSEISSAVGYKDPHYFSYLFKKTQHCSPMQYRSAK